MIIECFGLPGAGKTTMPKGLAARLSIEEIWLDGRRDLMALNLGAPLRHPVKYAGPARSTSPSSRRLQHYKLSSIDDVHSDVLEAMSEAGVPAERTSRPGDDHAPSASTSKP